MTSLTIFSLPVGVKGALRCVMEAFVMVVRVVTYTIIEGFPHPITPFTTSRGSTPSAI